MSLHLLQAYRLQRGMSKAELARRSGLTVRNIRLIENDPHYNLKRKTMMELAGALGLPASMIFFPDETLPSRRMLSSMMNHVLSVIEQDPSMRTNRAASDFVSSARTFLLQSAGLGDSLPGKEASPTLGVHIEVHP